MREMVEGPGRLSNAEETSPLFSSEMTTPAIAIIVARALVPHKPAARTFDIVAPDLDKPCRAAKMVCFSALEQNETCTQLLKTAAASIRSRVAT